MLYVWAFLTLIALTSEDAYASPLKDPSSLCEDSDHPGLKRARNWYAPSEGEMRTVISWGFEPAHRGPPYATARLSRLKPHLSFKTSSLKPLGRTPFLC